MYDITALWLELKKVLSERALQIKCLTRFSNVEFKKSSVAKFSTLENCKTPGNLKQYLFRELETINV